MQQHRRPGIAVLAVVLMFVSAIGVAAANPSSGDDPKKSAEVQPADTSAVPVAPAQEKPPAEGDDAKKPAEVKPADTSADQARSSATITVEAKRLSEELVYSVNRTAERTFDTPRAVQVITAEQIRRKAGFELSDIILQETGMFMSPSGNGGASIIIRGLASRQIMVMIDGVKINDSIWRTYSDTKEHFNLIDPNEIERIEILRGVVSVLGSEALGGVVNIITKKGPDGTNHFGASLSTRYSTADQGKGTSLQINGQGERYHYSAGVSGVRTEDLRSGDSTEQANTGYRSLGGHAHLDYSPSSEKTLSLGYRVFDKKNELLSYLNTGFIQTASVDPMRMQMATLRYDDLTNRGWEDSLTATGYWNRQDDGRNYIVKNTVPHVFQRNSDNMLGLNIEVGKFLGSHHVIYGVDHTQEKIDSWRRSDNPVTGVSTFSRGDYIDGGEYDATGVYLNDHFSVTKWLTVTAGARYGKYTSRGNETLPLIGTFDADSTKSNVTSSLNMVFHATPTLNFVANYVRGYRAPNMHDMTLFSVSSSSITIPNTNIGAERMKSMEGGVKYDSGRLSGSAFYFHNNLSNLLVQGLGLYDGKSYIDVNKNGVRNTGEPLVIVTTNIGQSLVKGYELDLRYIATSHLTMWGNYTRTIGKNNDSGQNLSRIQPRLGNVGVRLDSYGGHRLWAEATLMYGSTFVGSTGLDYPGFHIYTVRTGANLTNRLGLTVALENLLDQRYRFIPNLASLDQPGRQLVVATDFSF